MKTKHTPGPWKIDLSESVRKFPEIYSESGRRICRMIRHPGDEPGTPMREFTHSKKDISDAHLIAAAPEMLKECEMMLDFLENLGPSFQSQVGHSNAVFRLKALLKKARGE